MNDHNGELLKMMLQVAVPLWVEKWKARSWEDRMARARECAQTVAEKGDRILFKTKGTAAAFNDLAEALAILSFFPGGVEFAGIRWESKEGA